MVRGKDKSPCEVPEKHKSLTQLIRNRENESGIHEYLPDFLDNSAKPSS